MVKEPIVPYKDKQTGKKKQVAEMFDNISHRYDFLNHLLSVGIDRSWRKKAINIVKEIEPKRILDIATGTGDFAIEALKANPDKVTGVDISEGMLEIGRKKLRQKKLDDKIELLYGDSENLAFEENFFDAVIVAFGVRNFENLEKGLENMLKVVRKGGRVVILEFSSPQRFPFKQFFGFYSNYVLPMIGKVVSRDMSAYTYLPESIGAFPYGKDFLDILEKVGFKHSKWIPLTFGICSIYVAEK